MKTGTFSPENRIKRELPNLPSSALYLRLEVFKIVKWGPSGPFETPVCWKKRKKNEGRPFGDFKKIKKNPKKDIFEQSLILFRVHELLQN